MEQELSREDKLKAIYAEYEERMDALSTEQETVLDNFINKIREARKEELRNNMAGSHA